MIVLYMKAEDNAEDNEAQH